MEIRNQPPASVVEPPVTTNPVAKELAFEHSATISWRAIFAGTFISLLTYAILSSLGLAVGGVQLQDVIRGENAQGLGIGSAIWVAVSIFISLFVGSYYGGRVAGFIASRVGRVQGAVIAALFFGFLLAQAASAVALLGKGIGSTVGAVGSSVGDLASNPQIQQTVNEALQGQTLNAPVSEVAQGLAIRLLRGDTQAARNYLVQKSSMTDAQADQIVADIRTKAEPAAKNVAQASAKALSTLGWTLFLSMTLGTFFAVLGGGIGAVSYLKRPLGSAEVRTTRRSRAA